MQRPLRDQLAARTGRPTAPRPSGDWTIITRDDGLKQWAYKGKPLYAFAKDTKAGDKTGDGFLQRRLAHREVTHRIRDAAPAGVPAGAVCQWRGFAMADAEALLEPLIPALRRYAYALVRDHDAADDLVQDTLERALSRWTLRRPDGDLRAWLFTILRNLHVSALNASGSDAGRISIST